MICSYVRVERFAAEAVAMLALLVTRDSGGSKGISKAAKGRATQDTYSPQDSQHVI